MAIDTITIEQFIEHNRISIKSEWTDQNPHMDGSADMDNYKCVLSRGEVSLAYRCRDIGHGIESGTVRGNWTGEVDTWGKQTFRPSDGSDVLYLFPDEVVRETPRTVARMTLHFSKGVGHHGQAPEVTEVLDCLASDAAGIENSQDFEGFCSEYGYDTDSRKAEKTYKACVHQTERLKRFLGDDLYDQLVWHTEHQ